MNKSKGFTLPQQRDRKSGFTLPRTRASHGAGRRSSCGFTLLELVIAVGVFAVIGTAIFLVINPVQLLAKSRDSQRLSHLASLNTSIKLSANEQSQSGDLDPDGPNFSDACSGEANPKVFVSVPSDNGEASPTDLPTGWTYARVTKVNAGFVTGSGWMPVNLALASGGSPISNLPADPDNTFASGRYYSYVCTRNPRYVLTATLESKTYGPGGANDKVSSDGGRNPNTIEIGTNLALDPKAPVGYWKLDEGTGTVAYDASGNGNNGTLTNGPTWQSGASCKKGGCLSFDGVNDYVSTPRIEPTGGITMATWVKLTGSSGWQRIIGKPIGVNPWDSYQLVMESTTGKVSIYVAWGGAGLQYTAATSNTVLATGQWYFVSATSDGTTAAIYVNGVQEASGSVSNPSIYYEANNGTIGGFSSGAYFPGFLDDVRIYNRALSAAEIQAIYQATQ